MTPSKNEETDPVTETTVADTAVAGTIAADTTLTDTTVADALLAGTTVEERRFSAALALKTDAGFSPGGRPPC